MEILHLKYFRIQRCRYECSLGAYLVIDNLLCSFRYFTSVHNLKATGPLLMEILHFKDLGDTECRLATKSVVIVLGEYQIACTSWRYLAT